MSYKSLKSYQSATLIYDFTVEFCRLYVNPNVNPINPTNRSNRSYRTADQMTQAARSGKQNIVEGSSYRTSEKSELKLFGVARASFQELLEDYEDLLRQRGLRQWTKDSPEAREVRELVYKSDKSYWFYMSDPEKAANAMICLINQVNYLLDRQIKAAEEKFLKEGGYTENLYKRRMERRSGDGSAQWANRTDKTNKINN